MCAHKPVTIKRAMTATPTSQILMMMLPVNPRMRAASAVPGAKNQDRFNQDRFIDQHSVRAGTTDLRVLTALALVPAGAHLFELPNKIGLSQDRYFIVQSIYRGWALS
jgi:hypothetical protein